MSARSRPDRPVAVLGGAFDPVHVGHVGAARSVRDRLAIERVVLMPCAVPPLKTGVRLAPAEHRLRMLQLAVAGLSGVVVSRIEIERGGVSYTIDTLRQMRDGSPGVTPVFVLGSDALADLDSWKTPETLVAEFDLVVVGRPGRSSDAAAGRIAPSLHGRLVDARGTGVPTPTGIEPPLGRGGRIVLVDVPPVPVSSTEVRDRARRGLSLEGLVPPEVGRYIHDHRLYREEAAR